jgi:hypothetical protein
MQRHLQVVLSAARSVVPVPLPAQLALCPRQAACGPEAEVVRQVVLWAQRSGPPLTAGSGALVARPLRAASEQAALAWDASEAHPRAAEPAESDATAVPLPVVAAEAVVAPLDAAPPVVPLRAEAVVAAAVVSDVRGALPRAEEAASDVPEALPQAVVVVVRHAAAAPQEAVVERAAELPPVEAARAAAARLRAEVGRAGPAVVPAAVPSAVVAWASRLARLRPAAARRRAARSGHEMRCLQTASRSWRSSQAAQGEVWS